MEDQIPSSPAATLSHFSRCVQAYINPFDFHLPPMTYPTCATFPTALRCPQLSAGGHLKT